MARANLVKFLKLVKPYLAVIFLQFGYAGMAIVAKSALNEGMSPFTYAVYRNVFAAVLFAPFAVAFERKIWPKMTVSILLKIMALALLELEKVKMRKLHSQAKILGTVVTIGGAMIMTLVKGPNIGLPWTKHTHHIQTQTTLHSQQDFIKGAVMVATGCFCWASFYILQANTLKSYPAGLSLTCLICTMATLQASVIALVAERGVIMKEKGPVFVTAFNPLSMIIVAIMGSFMLSEQLDFGKALGAGVIVIGLYMVLWGKKQDRDSPESIGDQLSATYILALICSNCSSDLLDRAQGPQILGNDMIMVYMDHPNLKDLKSKVISKRPHLKKMNLKISYVDRERDNINIFCDEDLKVCFDYFSMLNLPIAVRLELVLDKESLDCIQSQQNKLISASGK
nr:WAT1-related protein At2g39510-like [Ipomoea batatas]